jgi:3-hydroxypropanoate dehydrogenase
MSVPTEVPALTPIDAKSRATLFTDARSVNSFRDNPVSDAKLREIWELARWAPTAANTQPLRVVFIRTKVGHERLSAHLDEGNRAKTLTAPAVAILAADLDFHEQSYKTFPSRPQLKDAFADKAMRHHLAKYNATLQAGYFILAVRAVGLAAGPMIGYDAAGIDAEFFAGSSLTTMLVVNIGYPGEHPWFDRLPRLDEKDVITWA